MQRRILFFAKAFSKECHAKDFLRGQLYANRLAKFRKMRLDNDPRADSEEGIIPWQDDGAPKVILMPQGQPAITLYGPGSMQIERVNSLNILCMYAALYKADEDVLLEDLFIPEVYVKFGSHVVLITDSSQFIERVERAIQRERYSMDRHAVRYVDPGTYDSSMLSEEIDAAFHKRQEYASEKEYRFAIDTNTYGTEAKTLDIGPIGDIAVYVNTSDINEELRRSGLDCLFNNFR